MHYLSEYSAGELDYILLHWLRNHGNGTIGDDSCALLYAKFNEIIMLNRSFVSAEISYRALVGDRIHAMISAFELDWAKHFADRHLVVPKLFPRGRFDFNDGFHLRRSMADHFLREQTDVANTMLSIEQCEMQLEEALNYIDL